MNGFGKWLYGGLAICMPLTALISCRKPVDAVKSDLGEAGYQLTVEDWFKACRQNEPSIMKKFVAAGFEPDRRDATGDSGLHAAVAAGARDSADFLLDRGLPVDLRGADNRTPLMTAVMAGQTQMVKWLLRQEADPRAKDNETFTPLMLAVRDDKAGAVAELAPYSRDSLDAAILLAAIEGRTAVIDTLTNYGASVYARMEDGRTPLMLAAQNGHADAVTLLLEIGASRLSTEAGGQTAADLANSAGHPEIVALLAREPLPGELALESPAQIAEAMDSFVNSSLAGAPGTRLLADDPQAENPPMRPTQPAKPISGETLSAVVERESPPATLAESPSNTSTPGQEPLPLPPIVMRLYREREIPVQVTHVEGDTARFRIDGATRREVSLRSGETIPGSKLVVVGIQKRMKDGKLDLGQPAEVSVVEVRDTSTGTTREWISGVPSAAHDPTALIEDTATGQRYTATPGQRFKSADGTEFIVTDVRPNQIVIENAANGAVRTLPLRGPRG